MSRTAFVCSAGIAFLLCAVSGQAAAQVSVQTPPTSLTVTPTVNTTPYLQATSTTCYSEPTVSMGYSFDSSQTTYTFNGAQNLQIQVPASQALSTGPHTINLKSWNASNQGCSTPVPVTVGGSGDAIAITSPADGNTLYSGFTLTASAADCDGQTTSSMEYSTDSNGDSSPFSGGTINTTVSTSGLATGWHILRVKAWGGGGSYCETDLQFNVPPANGLTPSSTAHQFGQIEMDANYTGTYNGCPNDGATNPVDHEWQTQPDCNSTGSSANQGSTTIGYAPAFPTYAGNSSPAEMGSREFVLTAAQSGGGVRWFDPLGADDAATHFIYDLWIYFPTTTDIDNLQELELDVNHAVTTPSKLLYVLGVQCSFGQGRWQVSPNGNTWTTTDQACSRSSFAAGTWHHVQIASEHGSGGDTTIQYESIAVDGAVSNLTCSGSTCLGTAQSNSTWASTIGPNFQMDGQLSGSETQAVVHAYVDAATIFYW